jgi:hypothetical protein
MNTSMARDIDERVPAAARHGRWHPMSLTALLSSLAIMQSAFPAEPPDFSGVWVTIGHDRPGAPFFIPWEPPLNDKGKAIMQAFVTKYDVETMEANAHCVEPGMPTVMWGIGGAAMEIVQQPERITLLSELVNQVRRIYLDGRDFPDDFPTQRVGYSIGHWEGDTLVIETRLVTEWHAPRWPHSDQFRVVERWRLLDFAEVADKITPYGRPGQRPAISGQVLVNEMTMSDPEFYVNPSEVVTVAYRRQADGVLFEDNCPEGIWMEQLEKTAEESPAR